MKKKCQRCFDSIKKNEIINGKCKDCNDKMYNYINNYCDANFVGIECKNPVMFKVKFWSYPQKEETKGKYNFWCGSHFYSHGDKNLKTFEVFSRFEISPVNNVIYFNSKNKIDPPRAGGPGDSQLQNGGNEYKINVIDDKQQNICIICMDRLINVAFSPCGHYSYCLECAEKIKNKYGSCSICNTVVTGIMRIFQS